MKSLTLFFCVLILTSCSLDNKTGLWKDASDISINNKVVNTIKKNESKERYENLSLTSEIFNKEVVSINKSNFKLSTPTKIENWLEQYGAKTNNISNFSYIGNKLLLSKSSKLGNLSSNKNLIFYENNLIISDQKGKIFIYSLGLKKKIFEYNFYKKKFKKFKKKVYLNVNNKILYVADNLGYFYAIDLNSKSLIWAKNYGIPFRSNLKFIDEQILLANQDNVIYSINAKTGEKNWQFATSPTFLKSDFKNNFVLDELNKNILFLNTDGELYSINYLSQKINWVLNFKGASIESDTELFLSQPIVLINDFFLISTESFLLNYNLVDGVKNWSFPSDTLLKPILTNKYTYFLSKKNLIICLDNKSGKVLWSKNIYQDLTQKIKKKKIGNFIDFKIANNELNLFSENGYLLSFDYSSGELEYIKRISKNGINSSIVFLKDNMFLIDNSNKLLKFN